MKEINENWEEKKKKTYMKKEKKKPSSWSISVSREMKNMRKLEEIKKKLLRYTELKKKSNPTLCPGYIQYPRRLFEISGDLYYDFSILFCKRRKDLIQTKDARTIISRLCLEGF